MKSENADEVRQAAVLVVTLVLRGLGSNSVKVSFRVGSGQWWALEAIHRGSLTLVLTLTLVDPRWIASSIHREQSRYQSL